MEVYHTTRPFVSLHSSTFSIFPYPFENGESTEQTHKYCTQAESLNELNLFNQVGNIKFVKNKYEFILVK